MSYDRRDTDFCQSLIETTKVLTENILSRALLGTETLFYVIRKIERTNLGRVERAG